MIRISVTKLEQGAVLAAPVRHPNAPEHILLQTGYAFEAETSDRLSGLGVDQVWIQHPDFDFLDKKLSHRIPEERVRLFQSVKESFSGIANRTCGSFDPAEYRHVIGDMIMAMVAEHDNAVWAERLMNGDGELFAHCSNVAYLSLVIGLRVRDYVYSERRHMNYDNAVDLTNLGIGAMLHDLGKLGLDEKWRDVHEFDDEADSDEYRSHAARGYSAVQGRIGATASHIVRHHHQRFDGHGFPKPVRSEKGKGAKSQGGREIHIFSRIVAVANVLDALISHHAKRNRPAATALSALQRPDLSGRFDPVILDSALRTVPPYPIGSCVELSDGRQAVVSDLNESSPCQPIVTLLIESSALRGTDRIEIDLSADDTVQIVAIGGQSVDSSSYTLADRAVKNWSNLPEWVHKALQAPEIHQSADQRGMPRHAWIAPAIVRFTRDGVAKAAAVKTLDISMEGLGFISTAPFRKDERLNISLQDNPGESMYLLVVHSTPVKQGFHVGCLFTPR